MRRFYLTQNKLMEIAEEKDNGGKRFSYWIYILACLLVFGVPGYYVSYDSMTHEWDMNSVISALVQTFIFSTLSWIVGRKYHLNYIFICALGVLVHMFIRYVMLVYPLLGVENPMDIDSAKYFFPGFVFVSLMFTGAILFISYPLQLLFNKIEKKLH